MCRLSRTSRSPAMNRTCRVRDGNAWTHRAAKVSGAVRRATLEAIVGERCGGTTLGVAVALVGTVIR